MAIAPLISSVLWIVGIGSVVGNFLGLLFVRPEEGERKRLAAGVVPAIVGIVLGIIGLVPATIMWSGTLGNNVSNALLNDPSYVDGSTYASQRFSTVIRESVMCKVGNIQTPSDNVTLWLRGCPDEWAIIISNPSGLNSQGSL